MGYKITNEKMDEVLTRLKENYLVYAPKWDRPHKNVRFSQIKSVSEIVTDRQSDFSIKEVFYPVSQVMFYFKGDNVELAEANADKEILIFCHACDINSIKRLDKIFMENRADLNAECGQCADLFYARLRDKVHFVLMECGEGFDDCFCVSTSSNVADDYVMAVKFDDGQCLVETKCCVDKAFEGLGEACDYVPGFVTENKKVLKVPCMSRENLKDVSEMDYWKQFDEKCIGCGGCNTVCGTCSCFDTVDVIYSEGSTDGERRRVWSSCMLDSFTETAGGSKSRNSHGANMRFKVFHKFYDFSQRFGTDFNMCVGCGRCDIRCPQDISFFDVVNGLAKEIEK